VGEKRGDSAIMFCFVGAFEGFAENESKVLVWAKHAGVNFLTSMKKSDETNCF
jgi:hypothetical protein